MIADLHLGYPLRIVIALAAALALAVLVFVWPVSPGVVAGAGAAIVLAAGVAIILRSRQLARVRRHSAPVLAMLGPTTDTVPIALRTHMPLLMVVGDALASLFDGDHGATQAVRVGDGAIWLRVDRPQELPDLAVAVRQWRDGRAPDGVVLCIAPALHADEAALAQRLRLVRQAVSDASHMLGTRLPGYVAVYQRLTRGTVNALEPQWYGASSATPMVGIPRFEAAVRAAERQARHAAHGPEAAFRAAGLAGLVAWTGPAIFAPLTDAVQPAAPWRLYGAGWIDCGPAGGAQSPWARAVAAQTDIVPAPSASAPGRWPLPQPLIGALPRRLWTSGRVAALGHLIALLACASALAIWGAALNNRTLVTQVRADLDRFLQLPADHDAARRSALRTLAADRDRLERYARTGVPLHLSFGMYRGAALLPRLATAIASYQPPPPPPTVITLDSMALFDSGKAQLRPGSNRALVGALEQIKAHADKRVLVAGHTDDIGRPEANLKLSLARAASVRDWLVDASGLPATQFAIQGYGDTHPIASNASLDGRARNRRVEITLIPEVRAGLPASAGEGA